MKFQFFVMYHILDDNGKLIFENKSVDIFEGTSQEAYDEMCVRLNPYGFWYYTLTNENPEII